MGARAGLRWKLFIQLVAISLCGIAFASFAHLEAPMSVELVAVEKRVTNAEVVLLQHTQEIELIHHNIRITEDESKIVVEGK